MTSNIDVRPSPIAGSWYSDDRITLYRQIEGFISEADIPELKAEVVGLIAPHAGYIYSGRTAAHAFKSVLQHEYELVAVLSPLHASHPAPLLTSAHQAYGTPLGIVEIDKEAIEALDQALRHSTGLSLMPVSNDGEHSLEIELPFLQYALSGNFKLLPLMIASAAPEQLEQLGAALAELLAPKRALLVASTDLSHFYPQATAEEFDRTMLAQIAALSPEGVLEAERQGTGFACGFKAVAAVLWATRELGANRVEILNHSDSAAASGDTSSVVGYGAAAILKDA